MMGLNSFQLKIYKQHNMQDWHRLTVSRIICTNEIDLSHFKNTYIKEQKWVQEIVQKGYVFLNGGDPYGGTKPFYFCIGDNEQAIHIHDYTLIQYPDNFRYLEWWEDDKYRQGKTTNFPPRIKTRSGDIYTIKKYFWDGKIAYAYTNEMKNQISLVDVLPATKKEYLNYHGTNPFKKRYEKSEITQELINEIYESLEEGDTGVTVSTGDRSGYGHFEKSEEGICGIWRLPLEKVEWLELIDMGKVDFK